MAEKHIDTLDPEKTAAPEAAPAANSAAYAGLVALARLLARQAAAELWRQSPSPNAKSGGVS